MANGLTDKHEIFIEIHRQTNYNEKRSYFIFIIDYNDTYLSKQQYNSRLQAEKVAFEKTFELLENKLN